MNAAKRFRPILLVFAASAAVALAQGGYEGATTFKASQILPPALLKGPHFQVKESVPTSGYFHDFDITSDYGDISAEGRACCGCASTRSRRSRGSTRSRRPRCS